MVSKPAWMIGVRSRRLHEPYTWPPLTKRYGPVSFQPVDLCRHRQSLISLSLHRSPQQGDEQIASSDGIAVQVPSEVVVRVV
jgi:hypothetical protein